MSTKPEYYSGCHGWQDWKVNKGVLTTCTSIVELTEKVGGLKTRLLKWAKKADRVYMPGSDNGEYRPDGITDAAYDALRSYRTDGLNKAEIGQSSVAAWLSADSRNRRMRRLNDLVQEVYLHFGWSFGRSGNASGDTVSPDKSIANTFSVIRGAIRHGLPLHGFETFGALEKALSECRATPEKTAPVEVVQSEAAQVTDYVTAAVKDSERAQFLSQVMRRVQSEKHFACGDLMLKAWDALASDTAKSSDPVIDAAIAASIDDVLDGEDPEDEDSEYTAPELDTEVAREEAREDMLRVWGESVAEHAGIEA